MIYVCHWTLFYDNNFFKKNATNNIKSVKVKLNSNKVLTDVKLNHLN